MAGESDCDVCILGIGPTALLALTLLEERQLSVCAVGDKLFGGVAAIEVPGGRISPLPVFATTDSYWFDRMRDAGATSGGDVRAHLLDVDKAVSREPIAVGSFAATLAAWYPAEPERLVITHKQLGPVAFREPAPILCQKVRSHYPTRAHHTARAGFQDGVSPYLLYLEHIARQRATCASILGVDLEARTVVTAHGTIRYRRLINTLPVLRFLSLARIPAPFATVGAGAQFVVASTAADVAVNSLIYDCAPSSPVHRVIVPRPGIVVAQVAHAAWSIGAEDIQTRLHEILALDHPTLPIARFSVRDCYPLGVSDDGAFRALKESLHRRDAVLFGRLAEWAYLDIEELDWSRIEAIN